MANVISFIIWLIVGLTTIITELNRDKEDKILLMCFTICWLTLILKLTEGILS